MAEVWSAVVNVETNEAAIFSSSFRIWLCKIESSFDGCYNTFKYSDQREF